MSGAQALQLTEDVEYLLNNVQYISAERCKRSFVRFVQEFWSEVELNSMSSRNGFDMMLALTEEATFQVSNAIEEFLFNGSFTMATGLTAYGYTVWPDRNHYTITDWASATPDAIVKEVIAMVDVLYNQNHYGPFKLYIPKDYAALMSYDYLTETSAYPVVGTIRDRLLQIEGLSEISVSRKLADNNIVIVEMSPRTIQVIQGLPMTVLDWEPPNSPNWRHLYKVMACMVPLLRSDYEGQNGICHGDLNP